MQRGQKPPWRLAISGHFQPELPFGDEVRVELEYVVIHEPGNRTTDAGETRCDASSWAAKTRSMATVHNSAEPALYVVVPAKQLASTFSAVMQTKKATAKSGFQRNTHGPWEAPS